MSETSNTLESLALEREWLTQAQVDECRAIRQKIIDAGVDSSLDEVLLKKTYLTKQQVAALNSLLGKGVKGAIEGYEILEKIAQGGMGAVYRAKQTSMSRVVAIKVLLPKFLKDPDAVERFTREARAVARLSHPNIVAGIDAGVSNGIYFYVMEFIDGESMEKIIARRGGLPWREAAVIIRQIASALDHAHAQGLVHRDIKPSNILLMKDGTAKLADLGLARLAAGEDINVTQSGTVLGTPGYISPEQARGDKTLDIRSDLYSLGLTFFDLLAGKPAFAGDNAFAIIEAHCTKDVPVEKLPREMAPIVAKMCARDRARRYQVPAQLVADLDTVLQGGQVAAPEPTKKTARKIAPAPLPSRPEPSQPFPAPLVAGGIAAALILVAVIVIATRPVDTVQAPPPLKQEPVKPAAAAANPPKEQTKPADPKLTEKEQQAIKAFKFAQEFEASNPDALEDARDLYTKVAAQSGGTPVYELASGRAQELVKTISSRMQEALDRLDREMRGLEAANRFGPSREAAEKADGLFRADEWKGWCSLRSKEALARARAAFDALMAKADGLVGSGDFAAASVALAVKLELPDFDRELARRREEIDRMGNIGPAARREADADDAAVRDATPRILQLLRTREYPAAHEAVSKLVETLRTRAALDKQVVLREWLAAAVAFRTDAHDRFLRIPKGTKVALEVRGPRRVEGTVKSITADSIVFEDDRTAAFQDLTVAFLFVLVDGPKRDDVDGRGLALLAVYEGELAVADRALEALTKARVPIPALVTEAWKALHAKPPDPAREKEAEKLLGDAEKALNAKKLDDGAAKLDKLLKDYADTAVVTKPDPRIRKCLAILPREIVLYAVDGRDVAKDWQLVDDKEAAGGKTLLSAARRQFPQSPQGAPSVDFKFTALKEVKYVLWMRQRRGADAASQNAVWLTIPDAVGADGQAWPAIMLQFFTNQGNRDTPTRGWTAHDQYREARRDPATHQFSFKTTGEHTLRIACCEDGTGFDQIIISAEKYLKSAPDVEIVPKAKK